MSTPTYEYHGLKVSTWDLWRGDTSNWSDRHFYLDIVREFGQPVLDVGCGTGRILLDYLAQGIDIDGADNSRDMLDLCLRKAADLKLAPTLYMQQMQSLHLPRSYRTILAPSSALQLITDSRLAGETVRRLFDHLEPGGALVGSFSFQWRTGDLLDTGWTLLCEKTRPEDGATVRILTREWHEPDKQLWHAEERFEIERDGQILESQLDCRSPEGRWYTQAQATELYRQAGFTDVRLFHEFTREPAREGDRLFCVLGAK